MAKRYKLLFRGQVRKDQHAAVVRGRLQQLLKASDAQLDVMFSGEPVSIKKDVDEPTAERYIDAFFKAGARLELVELQDAPPREDAAKQQSQSVAPQPAPATASAASSPAAEAASATPAGNFELAAVGADLLEPSQRKPEPVANVPTDHLSLAFPGTNLGGDSEGMTQRESIAVDTSHLTLDQPGATLGVPAPAPVIDSLLEFDFELGEVGEVLMEATEQPQPELPDLSHLSVESLPEPAEPA